MGERLLCKQEVIGSIPFTSTSACGRHLQGQICRRTSDAGVPACGAKRRGLFVIVKRS